LQQWIAQHDIALRVGAGDIGLLRIDAAGRQIRGRTSTGLGLGAEVQRHRKDQNNSGPTRGADHDGSLVKSTARGGAVAPHQLPVTLQREHPAIKGEYQLRDIEAVAQRQYLRWASRSRSDQPRRQSIREPTQFKAGAGGWPSLRGKAR
jgi:hypothetical protein